MVISWEFFFQEEYKLLRARNEMVFDIGANIGDSTVYFCANGAKKVFAIEPFPNSFSLLNQNVQLNGYSEIVVPLRIGVGNSKSEVVLDDTFFGSTQHNLNVAVKKDGSVVVPVYDLKEIVEQFDVKDALMKIDCEGCEYDFILYAENQHLRRFKRIAVEYHYGPEKLIDKFIDSGFLVQDNPVEKTYNRATRTIMQTGIILAERKN